MNYMVTHVLDKFFSKIWIFQKVSLLYLTFYLTCSKTHENIIPWIPFYCTMLSQNYWFDCRKDACSSQSLALNCYMTTLTVFYEIIFLWVLIGVFIDTGLISPLNHYCIHINPPDRFLSLVGIATTWNFSN